MSPSIAIGIIAAYFLALIIISFLTGKDDSNAAFFVGKKESPWYVVAFGMIGASLSGVTFISVPGWVATSQFSYMQMVLGYLAGYAVVATVLLPLYYRLNLTSIYGYLEQRFGFWSYKTGAFYFLLSRVIGASFRLYLVAIALHIAVFEPLDLPFWAAVLVAVLLIWVYTFRSGIKTIIWTDTLQTASMLLAVIVTIFVIKDAMGWGMGEMVTAIQGSDYSKWFFFDDVNDNKYFFKQFLAGMFITISMTGLDQDMMQKNLSCKNLKEAQKNMLWFSIVLVGANVLFLSLGALLYLFAGETGFDPTSGGDQLYPALALSGELGWTAAVLFIVGLVAAAYSSADSALTALTTSFCVDFLGMESNPKDSDKRTRKWVHIGFTLLLFGVIMLFQSLNDDSVIAELFKVAGFTYGPLLGLYAFGLFTKRKVMDRAVPFIAVAAPIVCYVLQSFSEAWFNGYKIGFELLLINGVITAIGLLAFSSRSSAS
ncbi:MAG: sodium:solute symporter [Flavobacteriales bacterium]|nr:sodium:solute symporter [Flavobacteriales bacterium]